MDGHHELVMGFAIDGAVLLCTDSNCAKLSEGDLAICTVFLDCK